MRIQVEDDRNLVRDSGNSAILNTDKRGLEEYRRQRNSKLEQQKRIESLEKELSETKEKLNELIMQLKLANFPTS